MTEDEKANWLAKVTGNQPAFPFIDRETTTIFMGMTLRDYFAAKAMNGLLSEGRPWDVTAKASYAIADAMLKARSNV